MGTGDTAPGAKPTVVRRSLDLALRKTAGLLSLPVAEFARISEIDDLFLPRNGEVFQPLPPPEPRGLSRFHDNNRDAIGPTSASLSGFVDDTRSE